MQPIDMTERERVRDSRYGLQGGAYGSRSVTRRIMGDHRTTSSPGQAATYSRATSHSQPTGTDRDSFRASDRHSMGIPPPRNGLRLRHVVLAASGAMAFSWRVAANPRSPVGQAAACRPNRLVPRHCRLIERTRRFWGAQTGPNPTDRRKSGTKHHVLTDGQGIPLAVTITGANRHDVTQLIPLVDAIPPIRGKRGRPRRKPNIIIGDRGYDSNPHRAKLLERQIRSLIARRNTKHGSGLGFLRWYVERTIGWLHKNRRLSVRYEKRADIHEAFLTLGCIMVCFRFIEHFC